ncbi:MAG: hypothetical protein WBO76_17020 [Saprospiraceae bacterium]
MPNSEIVKNFKIENSSFFPIHNLTKKMNYKEYLIVKRDGTILRRIFLNVFDPRLREQLIFIHYITRRTKFFADSPIGFNIISRDDPWDYKIELSTNENLNIEITSISDNHWNFEMLKSEERLGLQSNKNEIPFHELKKLNKLFPDQNVDSLIKDYEKQNIAKTAMVPNPFYEKSTLTLGRIDYPKNKLSIIIDNVIIEKEKKKHSDKINSVLIIDNRTFTMEIDDFRNAFEELGNRFQESPFKEIWLYTGYYSANDGNEAEYNFIPLKISKVQEKKLLKMVNEIGNKKNGIIYT